MDIDILNKILLIDGTIPNGLRWKQSNCGRAKINNPAGSKNKTGYWYVKINNIRYRSHRIIYMMVNNIKLTSTDIIDHIDRNKENNKIDNLRHVTSSENNRNRTKRKTKSTSIYKGVTYNNSRWYSQITINYNTIKLGNYKTEIEAAKSYNDYITTNNLEFFILNILP